VSLSSAQIGRCGELLVQYELLLRGVEFAPLTLVCSRDKARCGTFR
jgi:hypothetical protein